MHSVSECICASFSERAAAISLGETIGGTKTMSVIPPLSRTYADPETVYAYTSLPSESVHLTAPSITPCPSRSALNFETRTSFETPESSSEHNFLQIKKALSCSNGANITERFYFIFLSLSMGESIQNDTSPHNFIQFFSIWVIDKLSFQKIYHHRIH